MEELSCGVRQGHQGQGIKGQLPRSDEQLASHTLVVTRTNVAQHLDVLGEIERMTARRFLDPADELISVVGGLPKVETVRDIELKLHLGHAELLTLHLSDCGDRNELAGFALTFRGDFCVRENDDEWATFVDHSFEGDIPEGAEVVTARKLNLEPGHECIDLIMSDIPNRGVGSMLMNAAMKRAVDRGCHYLYALIDSRNLPSQGFFAKSGFERMGIDPANDSELRCADGSTTRVQWVTYACDPRELLR